MLRTWQTRFAVLPLLPLACAAQSTSSVELYGRVDMSVNFVHYSAKDGGTHLASDSSLWGLRGSEDLGSGKRAYFKLESWFSAGTGTSVVPTQFFSRESYVGLDSGSAGSVQMGSQYAPGFWLSVRADPFLRSNTGPFLSLLQRSPTNTRGFSGTVNNSLQYTSPRLGGVGARILYAPAEDGPGRFFGAGVEYTGDRLWAGLAVENLKVTAASIGAAGTHRSVTNASAGITYRLDAVKLHGYVLNNRVEGMPQVRGFMVGATIPAGPGEIRTAYTKRNMRDAAQSDASLAAVGYFYPLSRRTTLYTSIARLNNHGNANFNIYPVSMAAGVVPAGSGVTTTQFGLRHTF